MVGVDGWRLAYRPGFYANACGLLHRLQLGRIATGSPCRRVFPACAYHEKHLSDLDLLAFGEINGQERALRRGRQFHDSLVGLDFGKDLVRFHLVACLDVPFDYRALMNPLAEVRKPEFNRYANTVLA